MTTPISTRKSAKYRNFTQINKDSTTQDGAEFTLLVDRLFLGTGGHLVLSQGCEIIALFDEIKLNSLELTLFVDEDACQKLYRAFDIEMNISRIIIQNNDFEVLIILGKTTFQAPDYQFRRFITNRHMNGDHRLFTNIGVMNNLQIYFRSLLFSANL